MEGYFRARLAHTDIVYDLIPESMEDRVHWIQRLRIPEIWVFINDEKTAMVAYEPAYGHIPWVTGHAVTSKKGRGKPLRDLFWKSGVWLVENEGIEMITGVVPPHLKRYGYFLMAIGGTRQFEFNGTVFYTFDMDQLDSFKQKIKEKATCQQHSQE